jgi:hypothetical protein
MHSGRLVNRAYEIAVYVIQKVSQLNLRHKNCQAFRQLADCRTKLLPEPIKVHLGGLRLLTQPDISVLLK